MTDTATAFENRKFYAIETVQVASLVEYELNAKEHTPEQVETLKYSLSKFGQTVPLVIDSKNVVVAGHGRLLAMRELGFVTCAAIRVDEWDEQMAKEYRILDNRSNESPWIWKNLQIDLSSGSMPKIDLLFPDMTVGPLDVPNNLAAPLPNSAPDPEPKKDFRDPVSQIWSGTEKEKPKPNENAVFVTVECVNAEDAENCRNVLRDAGYSLLTSE